MPGQLYAVPGTNTVYGMFQATLFHDGRSTLWTPTYDYEMRGPNTNRRSVAAWTEEHGWWPSRSGFVTDPAASTAAFMNQDMAGHSSGAFEPWSYGDGGTQSLKFIMGRCKDQAGNGVSGATVQGFVTATDVLERETTANSDGYYELGTQWAGTQHYLVAYRAGSPDIAGTTVNTLTPTNRDGS